MTACNMNRVNYGKPTNNYHPTLLSILKPTTVLFGFSLTALMNIVSSLGRQKTSDKPTIHLLSTKQQTDTLSELLNAVENLRDRK